MPPRIPPKRETEIVDRVMHTFGQLCSERDTTASQWEEVAELIRPMAKNTFYANAFNYPGTKKTQRQVDASGMMALHRFGAILDSLLTPRNMRWHGLAASDEYVMKDRQTRLYFEELTKVLFRERYKPSANFSSQNQQNYQGLGAFGTGNMLCDALAGHDGAKGLRYKALPLGEMYLRENHQGMIDSFVRFFRLTARQALQRKDWADRIPEKIRETVLKNSEHQFDFLHYVAPNDEYDTKALDYRGKRWKSCYVSIEGRALLSEGGYYTFPVASSRYDQAPGEVYGTSPAMMVLPALKTLNAEKATFLKQGHRAGDPVLLGTEDGLINANFRPGSFNKGGMNADGKPLVGVLPTGNIQTTKEMMDEEHALIKSAFLVDLFDILLGDPKIFTATQIVEMASQRGILIAPTVGRQQSEYLGPLIEREIDVLTQQGLAPPMPGRLLEAKGEYHVVYTSPLSQEMRTKEVAGLTKVIEIFTPVANILQDPSIFDPIDFDVAVPQVANVVGVLDSWMASDEQVAAKRKARAEAQQRQEQIQAAPAAAALLKAKQGQPQGQAA